MAIIKLQKGEHVEFHVTSVVRDVPSQYGKETKFVGRTATDADACLFLKPETADRQLTRIGLTLDSAVGQTLVFAKPDKYIDISRVGALPPAPVAAPTPTSTATVGMTAKDSSFTPEAIEAHEKTRRDRICLSMKTALEYFGHPTLGMIHKMDELDMPHTPETIQALVTSLFIALNDARIR